MFSMKVNTPLIHNALSAQQGTGVPAESDTGPAYPSTVSQLWNQFGDGFEKDSMADVLTAFYTLLYPEAIGVTKTPDTPSINVLRFDQYSETYARMRQAFSDLRDKMKPKMAELLIREISLTDNTLYDSFTINHFTLKTVAVPLSRGDMSMSCRLIIEGADLRWVTLNNGSFAGVYVPRSDFTGAKLPGVDFTEAVISGSLFADADLSNTRFIHAEADGTDFTNTNLTGANFTGASIINSEMQGSKLDFVNMTDANCDLTNFSDTSIPPTAIMHGTTFHGAWLPPDWVQSDQY